MFRRLLSTGLIVAALLAGRVTAKPPDLPLPQNDVLAPLTQPGPAEATPYVFPPAAAPAAEASLFFRMRPSARRTMSSCLLFAAHPLLALAPTEEYVDFDEEDVPQGTIQALFAYPVVKESLADGMDESTPSACPWMRQQQQCGSDRRALPADIDLSQDVLHNLEMLREVQTLLQTARELGGAGQVCEAMDCLELAHDLCPSGWLDQRIEEAAAEVFASVCCDSPQEDADAASLQPCLPPVDPGTPAALDQLYPEISRPLPLAAGGGEEQEPPADLQKSVAKPLPQTGDLEETGCGKDGGTPISCLEVLKAFAAVASSNYGELQIGLDGSVRMFTQFRRGGAVWHLIYNNGSLSVWASPDGGADAEAPAENPPDDDSAD